MPVRPVLSLPAAILKRRADPVGEAIPEEVVADLVDTMRASPACVGLAAPQIGIPLRLLALDVSSHPKTTTHHGLVVLADPEIVDASGRQVGREGCMSVPDLTANVARPTQLVVRGRTPTGSVEVFATDGFEARAFAHEIDHLDGYLILDRVASLATDVFRRKVYR